MTERIEQAMRDELKSLDWMSDATKQKALEKLASLVNKIGYPDRWRDYRALSVSRDDFAGNVERGNLFEAHRDIAKIGKRSEEHTSELQSLMRNSYAVFCLKKKKKK